MINREKMLRFHKHMVRFVIIDSILTVLIISGYWLQNQSGNDTLRLLILILTFAFISYGISRFNNRKNDGVKLVRIILWMITGIFALTGLLLLPSPHTMDTIQGVLLLLLAFTTIRRARSMNNIAFLVWYGSHNRKTTDPELNNEEVLASCPSCESLLAIIPSLLTREDICPECGANLVQSEEE